MVGKQKPKGHSWSCGCVACREFRNEPTRPVPALRDITPGMAGATAQMMCPHCQVRGSVRTEQTKQKAGISGGKATGAILTGGVSLFATGLSRKQRVTVAHCSNCGATWTL
jgi:hypothetical protein